MANINETATYSPNIYQLDLNDPVLGGTPEFDMAGNPTTGYSNAPIKQLADRTAYLKTQVDTAFDDITTLEQDLANSTDPAKGAGLVGYSDAITYEVGSVGRAIRDIAANVSPFTINVRANGAVGDGVADDTAAIRACIAVLKTVGGGTLHFPQGRYKVSTPNIDLACLWIDFSGVRITGDGYLSEIFTEQNGAVPIHVSNQESLATTVSVGM